MTRAPTIDANGYAYYATGNGKLGRHTQLWRFAPEVQSGPMAGCRWSTTSRPGNEATLGDDDLSGSGFTLLPGTNLLLGGGKEGVLYLIDAAQPGPQGRQRYPDRSEDLLSRAVT